MPVPATLLADVLVRDPHPPVPVRLRDQALEGAAVVLLDPAAAPELALGLLKPDRERVADPLEVADAEDAGPADGADAPLDPLAGEGGGEELAEALLERSDLAPQLVAGASLGRNPGTGSVPAGSREGLGDAVKGACGLRVVSLEQLGQLRSLRPIDQWA
jgi:hypothetical protein